MNGYEFTRFEADYTSKVKAQSYDVNTLADMVKWGYEKKLVDYTELPDYADARNWFIETTMSCNRSEALRWMKYYMANAIAYGIMTKSLDWKTKFLAAWDLFLELGLAPAVGVKYAVH